MTIDVKTLETALRSTGCEVTFRKISDGTVRTMKCTTNPAQYTPMGVAVPKTERKIAGLYSVVDTEKKAWRSFRLDTVISVKAL